MNDTNVEGIFHIKPQSEYMPGYIVTGFMAIFQTIIPLFVYQFWKKEMLMMDTGNMWYQYAWQAMQAGGVVSFGMQTMAYLGGWLFDYNVMERLAIAMLWVTHGGIAGMLTVFTVISYLVVAVINYEDSIYSTSLEMGLTMMTYGLVQIGFAVLTYFFAWDTFMYLVSGEMKELCEKYGELCSQYGVLEKNDNGDDFEETDGTSLVNWVWA